MPIGDWGPGTTLAPGIINITTDELGVIDHVGIGYHLVTPSGERHPGAFTWHSPKGQYAQGPSDKIDQLQAAVTALLRAAAEYEGVELGAGGPPARGSMMGASFARRG